MTACLPAGLLVCCQLPATFLDSPKTFLQQVLSRGHLFWDKKGPRVQWALCTAGRKSSDATLGETCSKLHTIRNFKHLCAWSSQIFMDVAFLKTRSYLLGWRQTHSLSFCREFIFFMQRNFNNSLNFFKSFL